MSARTVYTPFPRRGYYANPQLRLVPATEGTPGCDDAGGVVWKIMEMTGDTCDVWSDPRSRSWISVIME